MQLEGQVIPMGGEVATEINFFVAGLPKPAGSKRAFFIKSLGRAIITDANPNSKDWKTDVKFAAEKAYTGAPLTGPICLELHFFLPRPAGHYGSGKNSSRVKDSAPKRPVVKPDVLKLARGVEDSLSKIVYVDDAQIVDEVLAKSYTNIGQRPGVNITVRQA